MKSRVLAAIGLACPLILVAVVLLMRAQVITFANDFTGFNGLGFFLWCLVVVVPLGLITSGVALWLDRRSTLARAAVVVNALVAVAALLLIGQLMF
jgi:hypothetical protein